MSTVSCASEVLTHQPTTRRENRSMNTTRYSHPRSTGQIRDIADPHFVGTTRVKGPVQQVRGCLQVVLRIRGHHELPTYLRPEALTTHRKGHAVAPIRLSLCRQRTADLQAPIPATAGLAGRFYQDIQKKSFLPRRRFGKAAPGASASRRSVLMRSPGLRGISEGVTTVQSCPRAFS